MPPITFKGDVRDASGAATILSVTGQDFDFNDAFDGSFSRTLNLFEGEYLVIVNCLTDGEMEFDITGNYSSVNPEVPETFDKDNTGNTYDLTV